jgi:hypothetical protein
VPDKAPARFMWPISMALAVGLFIGASTAQAQSVTTVQVRTTVLTPLSLVKDSDMVFGTIVRPSSAGTVVLTPAVTSTCTTTGGLIRSGTCQAATFLGWGATNQVVRLRFTSGTTITLSNGLGQTMTVTNRTVDGTPGLTHLSGNVNSNGNVRYRVISANGQFDFRVGGQLNVAANQALGLYSGTFEVEIQYD